MKTNCNFFSSIWGEPPKDLLHFLESGNIDKAKSICVVGCSDGQCLFPIMEASKAKFVDAYEVDSIYVNGGYLDDNGTAIYIQGLKSKLYNSNISKKVTISEKDFYSFPHNLTYDFVFTMGTLQYLLPTSNITVKEKVENLQTSVNTGGILYIKFMMNIDKTKQRAQLLNPGEMKSFFSTDWEIIDYFEEPTPHLDSPHILCRRPHFHKSGRIIARKVSE